MSRSARHLLSSHREAQGVANVDEDIFDTDVKWPKMLGHYRSVYRIILFIFNQGFTFLVLAILVLFGAPIVIYVTVLCAPQLQGALLSTTHHRVDTVFKSKKVSKHNFWKPTLQRCMSISAHQHLIFNCLPSEACLYCGKSIPMSHWHRSGFTVNTKCQLAENNIHIKFQEVIKGRICGNFVGSISPTYHTEEMCQQKQWT